MFTPNILKTDIKMHAWTGLIWEHFIKELASPQVPWSKMQEEIKYRGDVARSKMQNTTYQQVMKPVPEADVGRREGKEGDKGEGNRRKKTKR